MKIETNFNKEEGIYILPNIIIGYNADDKEFVLLFAFACWEFSIEFCFK